MNEADWTPSPTGEREALLRQRRLVQHDLIALAVGALGIVVATILWVALFFHFFTNGYVLAVAVIGALIADFALAARVDRRRDALQAAIAATDQALREEFGAGHGWLVDLLLLQGTAPVGSDRGMLWIEDGLLMFSGHRTSFALSPDQVEGSPRLTFSLRGLRHGLTLPLIARPRAGRLAISLGALANSEESARLFERELLRWSKGPAKPGGQLPPTVPGPGMASRPRVLAGALVSSAYWIGVVALVVRLEALELAGVALLGAALIAFVLHLWYPLARFRAWHDLGKVRALPKEDGT